MHFALGFYAAGLVVLLVTYLPFSPLTIDLARHADGIQRSLATDTESNSYWDAAGRATAGRHHGFQLAPVPRFDKLFRFGWALFKPHTRLFSTHQP